MSYAIPNWVDGAFSSTTPVSLPEFEAPIPGVAAEYILRQKFWKFRNNYDSDGPLALNTAHYYYDGTSGKPLFVLVEEGPRRDIGGGMVEFVRTYAKKPATHYDWDTYTYNFIGSVTDVGNGTLVTRDRLARIVKSMIQYDYYLVAASGGDYTSVGAIPIVQEMIYCYQDTLGGALYGGLQMQTDKLLPSSVTPKTWPTSEDYNQYFIADATNNGWGGTTAVITLYPTNTLAGGPPPTSGHMAGSVNTGSSTRGGIIPVEPSKITRWMGNFWQRATRYVLAQ